MSFVEKLIWANKAPKSRLPKPGIRFRIREILGFVVDLFKWFVWGERRQWLQEVLRREREGEDWINAWHENEKHLRNQRMN
jgi:hypothetical protein